MSYLVLARKYRPQKFDQVVGQTHVTRTLIHAIEAQRLAHAILFSGPRGTGKTTVARILAKAMNCARGPLTEPCNQCRSCLEITSGGAADVFEIDGASNNSVEQVRELRENLRYMPTHSRYKIYIIDEVHMLSQAAFNALLKTLEEPPPHILFMFATTEAHKIPITILSRCQRHDLRRIASREIAEHLGYLCELEHADVDTESLDLIAREAGGSLRDALSLMDHVLACAQGPVTVQFIFELMGIVDREHLFQLSEAVFARNLSRVLERIDEAWRQGYEMKRFYSDLVSHFHHLTLAKIDARAMATLDLPAHEIDHMQAQVDRVDASELLQLFDLLFQAEASVKLSSQPRFALEITFLKMFQRPAGVSIDTLIEKLDVLRADISSCVSQPDDANGRVKQQNHAEPEIINQNPERENGSPAKVNDPSEVIAVSEECVANLDCNALWEKMIARVSEQKPSLAALLKNCVLSFKTDDSFELKVQGNDYFSNSVTRQRTMLEKLFFKLIGRSVKLMIVSDIENETEKQKLKKKAAQIEQKTLSHPMVMEAIKLFDGKVVDVNIL